MMRAARTYDNSPTDPHHGGKRWLQFELGEDETGGPCFFWVNPWTQKREKVASLWWPEHPVEATAEVEHIFSCLKLICVDR